MDNKGRRNNSGREIYSELSCQKPAYKGRERRVVTIRRKAHREKTEGELSSFSFNSRQSYSIDKKQRG